MVALTVRSSVDTLKLREGTVAEPCSVRSRCETKTSKFWRRVGWGLVGALSGVVTGETLFFFMWHPVNQNVPRWPWGLHPIVHGDPKPQPLHESIINSLEPLIPVRLGTMSAPNRNAMPSLTRMRSAGGKSDRQSCYGDSTTRCGLPRLSR